MGELWRLVVLGHSDEATSRLAHFGEPPDREPPNGSPERALVAAARSVLALDAGQVDRADALIRPFLSDPASGPGADYQESVTVIVDSVGARVAARSLRVADAMDRLENLLLVDPNGPVLAAAMVEVFELAAAYEAGLDWLDRIGADRPLDRAVNLCGLGRLDEAKRELDSIDMATYAPENGPRRVSRVDHTYAQIHLAAGDLDAASRTATRSMELAQRYGISAPAARSQVVLAQIEFQRGRPTRAHDTWQAVRAEDLIPGWRAPYHLLATRIVTDPEERWHHESELHRLTAGRNRVFIAYNRSQADYLVQAEVDAEITEIEAANAATDTAMAQHASLWSTVAVDLAEGVDEIAAAITDDEPVEPEVVATAQRRIAAMTETADRLTRLVDLETTMQTGGAQPTAPIETITPDGRSDEAVSGRPGEPAQRRRSEILSTLDELLAQRHRADPDQYAIDPIVDEAREMGDPTILARALVIRAIGATAARHDDKARSALDEFEALVDSHGMDLAGPQFTSSGMSLVIKSLNSTSDFTTVVEKCTKTIEYLATEPESRMSRQNHLMNLATAQVELGRIGEAAASMAEAATGGVQGDRSAQANFVLGRIYMALGFHQMAIDCFEQATQGVTLDETMAGVQFWETLNATGADDVGRVLTTPRPPNPQIHEQHLTTALIDLAEGDLDAGLARCSAAEPLDIHRRGRCDIATVRALLLFAAGDTDAAVDQTLLALASAPTPGIELTLANLLVGRAVKALVARCRWDRASALSQHHYTLMSPIRLNPLVLVNLRRLLANADSLTQRRAELAALRFRQAELERDVEHMRFVAVHDVRGPLAVLTLALDLIGARADGTTVEMAKTRARSALARLVELLDATLALGDLAIPEVNAEPVDLTEELARIVEELAPMSQIKDLSVSIEGPTDGEALITDRSLVCRAARALLLDAITCAPRHSTVTVTITDRADTTNSQTSFEIVVGDQGEISPAVVSNHGVTSWGRLPTAGEPVGFNSYRIASSALKAVGGTLHATETNGDHRVAAHIPNHQPGG